MKGIDFIKNVEGMVDPVEVGTIHYVQSFATSIPKNIQYKMISNGAKKNPYMGFVVEPYSFFLCYEIIDVELANSLIPDNYRMIKTKIFEEGEPKYYSIFGCFNVHTSAFWGTRMEFYVIAENTKTGLLSWVIIDYDTNTVSYDEKRGLHSGNTNTCVFTTSYDGDVIVDIRNHKNSRDLVVDGSIKQGQTKALYQRLWLEGNLSVTYGRELSHNKGETFAVIFNAKEVEKALQIPHDDVTIHLNSWYPNLIAQQPSQIVCFPYAQHFLSDSPGHFSQIKNEVELMNQYNSLDFSKIPKYSSKSIKQSMKIGQLASFIIIVVLLVAYLMK